MTETMSTLRRMFWLFPDRESTRSSGKWAAAFWDLYSEVAKELDLTWERTAPEAISVDALDPCRPKFYVNGERVTPQDTLFITSLYSLPYQSADVLNQLTLYSVLEEAGFYLPHPARLAVLCNDKLATILKFADCPVPPVPTVRIGSGRDLLSEAYVVSVADLPYPALAKPASWCAARGINLARDLRDVRGLLSLAQGGDTTLVFQPYLGDVTRDYRVYLVDGQPLAVLARVPGDGTIYTQLTTGGTLHYAPFPEELRAAVDYFAAKVPVPYLCVDFLHDGERFYFSEIELDGTIQCPDPASPTVVEETRDLIRARFAAYRAGHARTVPES